MAPNAREVRIAPAAARKLMRYAWSLDIRELEQVLGVATALADGGVIEPAHLGLSTIEQAPAPPLPTRTGGQGDPEASCRYLVGLLERHRGNLAYVARDMGKAKVQVHRWRVRFGIDPNDYRD